MARKNKKTRAPAKTSRILDDETSARVLAEFLVLDKVEECEIDAIMGVPHGLSYREIAISFRIADVLKIRDAFEMAPRFRVVFTALREALNKDRTPVA
jgi:hypothetical protein